MHSIPVLLKPRLSRALSTTALMALLLLGACGSAAQAQPQAVAAVALRGTQETGSQHRFERPSHDLERFRGLFDDDAIAYKSHVYSLANPFFEGRAPGTVGNDLAAEYIEFYFERLGLEPVFSRSVDVPGGTTTERALMSYRQLFPLSRGTIEARDQHLTLFTPEGQATLIQGEDFMAMGISGNANASGEVVFVGYSIEEGPDDYASFDEDCDLTDKIALVLRFEPIDDEGKSKWADGRRWSRRAGLMNKLSAVQERGAAGVLLVSPPGADDPRAGVLEQPGDTRVGTPLDIPILMITQETASIITTQGDDEGRDLATLTELVSEQGQCVSLGKVEADILASLEMEELTTNNVAAMIPGKGELADEYIVIGAHYDHVGYGAWGARGNNRGVIHVGADDNASGVAGTLVLASRFAQLAEQQQADSARRSMVFVLFSAEEMGLIGSTHFVEESPIDLDNIYAMLNMDMIGAMEDDTLTVYGTGTAAQFDEVLTPIFEQAALKVDVQSGGSGRSDEAPFHRQEIPGLHFFSGVHDRYHTPRDTPDSLNYEGAMTIVDLVEDVAADLVTRTEDLTYEQVSRMRINTKRTEISVFFGIAPGGYGEDAGGVLIGQVIPGTTAAQAGLQKGDRIVAWGGEPVANIAEWMDKLKGHKPGDAVDIVISRDGEQIEMGVLLKGRE